MTDRRNVFTRYYSSENVTFKWELNLLNKYSTYNLNRKSMKYPNHLAELNLILNCYSKHQQRIIFTFFKNPSECYEYTTNRYT